jgi:hypothetical protein
MAPVPYFDGFTAAENEEGIIEYFEGASLTNTLPGSFDESLSSLAITASTDSSITNSMLNQVAATGLTYEFDVFLVSNDIPKDS